MDDNEFKLIMQAKRDNPQALATLLQLNYAKVYRYLLKLTMDNQAAQDITQDVMERAIVHIKSFDPARAKLSTWLIAMARNKWLDEVRRQKRTETPLTKSQDWEHTADPYVELLRQDELMNALQRVKPDMRTPITMCYMLGYSYDDISNHMKIPLGTVKSRISNGLKQLKRELERNET